MDNSATFLSFIIPCYNVAEYLPHTIQSLEALTDAADVEFLFVDDGSKDNTLSFIEQFAKTDSRVRYVHQSNAGVSAARNALLPLVSGKYFTLLDGDDYIDSNAVNIIRSHINDVDLLIPDTVLEREKTFVWHNGIPVGTYTPESFCRNCPYFPITSKLVYRTSIMKEHGLLFDTKIKCGEVYDFTISFLQYTHKIEVISEAYYHYVARSSSATHHPNYQADLTSLMVVEKADKIDKQQHPWIDSVPLHLTAFRMVSAFTYLKYLRQKISADEVCQTIEHVKHNPQFRKVIKTTAFKPHSSHADRLKALYVLLMPTKLGYQLLSKLS